MKPRPHPGWDALAVAATYVYFLIFAEFALLKLGGEAGLAGARLQWMMGALALGGITGSALAAGSFEPWRYGRALAAGFVACAAGAALATVVPARGFPAVAAWCGLSLGWLTVTLAAGLAGLGAGKKLGWWTGVGTGLAYAFCNLPWIFALSPRGQAWLGAAVCFAGALLVWRWQGETVAPVRTADYTRGGQWAWLFMLLSLVWLDSAAFYVIQHEPALREPTWGGSAALWTNAAVHFGAALVAGWLLDRGALARLAALACAGLGLACWRLGHGWLGGTALLYTAAVSLYSTLLVVYPARSGRPWLAAAVYAFAGWLGSALGIGMAQDLHTVPDWFLLLAAVWFGLAWLGRNRLARRVAVLVAAGLLARQGRAEPVDLVARGREVYIAEGCIHCHSQYVRPDTPDVTRWGPPVPVPAARAGDPPLLGNRRQGPDLANVGLRRTPEWNRLHLISPQAITPGSRMPAYAPLFDGADGRGTALVAYLATLGADHPDEARQQQAAWQPAMVAVRPPDEQRRLFQQLCAACHGPAGRGDGPLASRLTTPPPDFARGWRRLAPAAPDFATQLARLIKFGVNGTPMAGHEYLADRDVLSLAAHVQSLHSPTRP